MEFKVAIVGGSGYVGSSLARFFLKEFDVKIVDKSPLPKNLKGKVDYVNCDIRKFDEIATGISDADLVIDTAIIQIPLINEQKRLGYEVNVLGTQNICKAVEENELTKGMILAGTWHVIGERGLRGLINEEFGFRPDKVEERARLYAFSKIMQETIVRFYDEMSEKVFGIIRLGTVLGEGMPEKTAANIFIKNGLLGKPLTPFKHSMHRPMLYVDINDVCRSYEIFAKKILKEKINDNENSISHIFNVYHPNPITIVELAKITKNAITEQTKGRIVPAINIVDNGQPNMFDENDKKLIKVDVSKSVEFFQKKGFKSPKESIQEIIKQQSHSID